MPPTDAVSVSSTCAVPLTVGAPVAGLFGAVAPFGPVTVAAAVFCSGRGLPPPVQTAPVVPHSRSPGSVMLTAARDSGSTVISHRSLRPSTRRAP